MATPAAESPNKVFQCDMCTYHSQNEELFERHMAIHTTDQPFECTVCDFKALHCSSFVAHLAVHQRTGEIQCPFCPHASSASSMKVHVLEHRAAEVFDCSNCEFTSNSSKSLKHHTEIHHNQLFKCEYCRKCMAKHSMIKHWDDVHGIREVLSENAKEPSTQTKDFPLLKPGFSCSMLYPAVTLKTEDDQDEDGITNTVHAQGLVVEGNDKFETGEFAEIEKSYACPVCEFSSHLKVVLKFHVLSMHTKKYSCRHCSSVMTKHALIQHYKNFHGIYVYFDGRGLQEGISKSKELGSLAHSGDYRKSKNLVRNPKTREVSAKMFRKGDKFICSICKYSSKSSIESHIDKLHRRKFFCNHCPAVMTKHALVEHARLKHGVTLSIKNRFIIEAKSGMYSRPGLGSDGEESNEVSEEDTDRDNVWSNPSPINVSIIRKGDQFICSICRYSVTMRYKVERHIDKVHARKFYCKYCSEIMTKHELVEHCMVMHGITWSTKTPGLKEFREDLDDTSQGMDADGDDADFGNDYEDYPPSTHTGRALDHGYVAGGIKPGKRFACSICDFSSHNEWSLTCHMKFLHTVKYHCNHCPAIMTKYDIMKHTLNEHGIEIRPRGPSGLREASEDSERQDTQNFPVVTDKVFTADNYMGHFMDDTQTHSDPEWQNGIVQTSNPFSCAICSFRANSNWHLRKHMDSFHKKKFCCPHCAAVLTKHELIEHAWSAHGVTIKTKNSKLKEFVQDGGSSDSDGEKGSEYDPGTSVKDKGTKDKQPCPSCDYTAYDWQIKVHVERMHTGEYRCEYCTSVLTKYELIKHYEKEHGYDFGRRGHRGYRFKKASAYMDVQVPNEQTYHSNEASKVCSFCDYTSIVAHNIVVHEETMHKVKYHCEHCPAVMTKYNLIRHYKDEHGIDAPLYNRSYQFRKAAEQGDSEQLLMNRAVKIKPGQEHSLGPSTFVNENASNTARKACSSCDYKSVFPKDVMMHEERMHRVKFHCDHCPAVMVKYDLLQHNKIKHGVALPYNHSLREAKNVLGQDVDAQMEVQSDGDDSESPSEAVSSLSASKNVCSFCGYIGNQFCHLEIHVERMHTKKFHCGHCTAVMSKYQLLQHYKNLHGITVANGGRGMPFVEASPEKATDSLSYNHIPATANGNSHETNGLMISNKAGFVSCSICDFSTKREQSLELHMDNWHKRKYVCNDCPAFMTKHEIIEHSKDVHGVIIPRFGKPSQALRPADDLVEQAHPINDESGGPQHKDSGFKADAKGEKFKCNVCSHSAIYRKSMVLHVINMHRKKYSCNHCSTVLSKYELILHSKDIHGVEIPWNGRGYVFEPVTQEGWNNISQTGENSQPDVPERNDSAETGKFKCPNCEFTSLYPSNLKCHVENIHTKLFCCNKCSAVKTKYDLYRHYLTEHNIQVASFRFGRCREYRSGSPQQINTRGSEHFGTMDTQGGSMGVDYDDEAEFIDSVMARPGSTLKPEIFRELTDNFEHIINVNGEMLSCSVCGYASKYKYHLLKHIHNLHSKNFKCGTCSDVMTKYDLIQHYNNVHNVIIPDNGRGYRFQEVNNGTEQSDNTDESESAACPQSVKPESTGQQTEDLERFVKVEGDGEAFSCSICGISCKYKASLVKHINILHSKKFNCGSCSAVMTKYDLIQHYKNAHDVTILGNGRGSTFQEVNKETEQTDNVDESEFTCAEFGNEQNELVRVEQNGEDFICSECGWSSEYKYRMQCHVESMHTRKYCCKYCSVVMSKYNLIQHYNAVHNLLIPNLGRGPSVDFFQEVRGSDDAAATDDGDDEDVVKTEGGFKCTVCDYFSTRKSVVKNHLQSLHWRKYSCNRCSVIMTKYEMIKHYENEHDLVMDKWGRGSMGKFFKSVDGISEGMVVSVHADDVSDCSAQGGPSTSDMHIDSNNEFMSIIQEGGQFKCSVCGFSTLFRNNLIPHFESFHRKKYSCNCCSVIMTKYEIIQHYETNHDVLIDKWGRGSVGKFFKKVDPSEGVDEPVCADDMADSSAQDGPSTPGMQTENDEEIMTIIEEGGQFKCSICGHSTSFKYNLNTHFESFHKRKYSCNHCSIVTTKYGIVCHYENTHRFVIPNFGKGNLAPYCKAVNKNEFSVVMDSSVFADGMVETVMDDRVNAEVNDDFADGIVETFLGHSTAEVDEISAAAMIREDGEFKCAICGHTTALKGNLTAHMEALHKKKYSCNRCSLVMAKYDMIRHYEADHNFVIPSSRRAHFGGYFNPVDNVSAGLDSTDSADDVAERLLDGYWISGVDDDGDDREMDIIEEGEGFKCSFCGHTTAQKGNLTAHIEALHKKKYSCKRCSVVLTKYEMIQHYETDHNVEIEKSGKGVKLQYFKEVDQASEINDSGADSSDVGVSISMEGGEFKCSICDHSSNSKLGLDHHLNAHHEKKYSCNQCSIVTTKYGMVKHYETDHAVKIRHQGLRPGANMAKYCKAVISAPGEANSSDLAPTSMIESAAGDDNDGIIYKEGAEFKCSICDFSSVTKFTAEKHLISLHKKKFSCNRCSVVMAKYDMMQHFEYEHNVEIPYNGRGQMAKYYTPVDGDPNVTGLAHSHTSTSASTSEFASVAEIEGIDELKCTSCDFTSKLRSHLMLHMENMHTKRFTCQRCSIILTKRGMIKHCEDEHGIAINKLTSKHHDHFIEVADNPKSFADGERSTFTDSAEADGENTVHSEGDGTLSCCVCDFSTKHSYSLELHMVNLHKKKYACDHCPAILTKCTLIKHCEKVHGVTLSRFNNSIQEVEAAGLDSVGNDREDTGLPADSSALKVIADGIKDNPDPSTGLQMTGGLTMFSCSLCDYSSKLRMHLNLHTKNMHSTKQSCNLCSEVMAKHELLNHHCTKPGSSKEVKLYKPDSGHRGNDDDDAQGCGAVDQRNPSKPLIDLTGAQNQFRCTFCEFSSVAKFSLISHVELLHTKKYFCNHCPAIMTKHELLSHCKDVHGVFVRIKGTSFREAIDALENSNEYGEISDAEAMQARSTFNCSICNFTTKAKWYLKDHTDKFHRRKYCCVKCPAVMTKYALIKHLKNFHGIVYSTRQPLIEFDELNSSAPEGSNKILNYQGTSTSSNLSESSAQSNKQETGQDDRAQCSKCEFSTRNKFYLKDHMESFHIKKYSCRQCLAVMTKHELVKHSKDIHGVILKKMGKLPSASATLLGDAESKYSVKEFKKPKRFHCNMCSFSSFHPFGLKRHVKIHHSIKYPCQHCPAVMTRHALIKHCRILHNTQIPENPPNVPDLSDHRYSSSQVFNPKCQSQQQTTETVKSPAFQPVVFLERLDIDVEDLDSTFSIVDNTPTDSAKVKNPKFHDPFVL